MVKTFVAALVCGTFFVAHLSAQEVFSGEQKAKPKYPKAEAAQPEPKVEKAVAVAPSKPAAAAAHPTAPAQKPDNNSAKKVAAATNAKPLPKPAARDGGSYNAIVASTSAKPATITKATPTVMPGQRAPAATPSPIVKPEPPLIAKAQPVKTNSASSTANPKVPLAAVPPPTKVAQTATKAASKPAVADTHTQTRAGPVVPNKVVASNDGAKSGKAEVKAQSTAKVAAATTPKSPAASTKTSTAPADTKTAGSSNSRLAVAPPAEGPKHDIVMQVKKHSAPPPRSSKATAVAKVTAPAVAKNTALTVTKATAPATKPAEDAEEDEAPTSASVPAKPASAPVASVVARKSPAPKQTVDARSIAAVPVSLQTRRDAPSGVTKVALVQRTPAETVIPSPANDHFETAFTKLADGFDYPVGRPDAQGYYRARGFRAHGHLGEDWDGVGGGNTDLGDPIYTIGDGLVVFARDCHMGWGNVVIVRHSYREGGAIRTIDSLYGHLDTILVRKGQAVTRGQKIATMGTAHGLYDAHLHLEIRKNIEIGMSRAAFAQDFSNYYDPSQFIQSHRHLVNSTGNYRVAMNTFTHDSLIRWDKVHNYTHAHTGGGTSESSAALKKALAAKSE